MAASSVGQPGLALVCDFEGTITDVAWDDLGVGPKDDTLGLFVSLLDPGSIQKGLALLLHAKEHSAAFGWELNLAAPDGTVPLQFGAVVVRDRVVLMASVPSREDERLYEGLSRVVNEQVNTLRTLTRRTAGGAGPGAGAFERDMIKDMLRLNNRLVNAERELARKNAELKRLSAVLNKDLQLAHRVVQCTGDGVAVVDAERRVVEVNQAFTAITGFARQAVLGTTLSLNDDVPGSGPSTAAIWEDVARRGSWQGECMGRRQGGEAFPRWLTISAVPDDLGRPRHYVITFSDITRLKDAEERWQKLAFYDSLTNLPNRVLYRDRLEQALARARRDQEGLVLLFIDLDDFKMVNDGLGHDAGDELLSQAARRIEASVRATDSIARLGGDEFTVILSRCADDLDAVRVAAGVIQALTVPFSVGGQTVHVGASIGIARFPGDGEDADTLTRNADAAMYAAKAAGRKTARFFSSTLGERISRHLQVRGEIARGLQADEFHLHFQPVVDLRTGAVRSLEALLRWQSDDRGLVTPDHFVPIAEDSGLIVELGQRAIRQAIAAVAELRAAGHASLTVAVNVSRRQFATPGLAELILAELARHRLPGEALIVEVTETVAVGNLEHTIDVLRALRAHGVTAAIDDFGTGYSSLHHARRLPVRYLKIDRSFVADVDVSPEAETIIRAISAMARSMGLVTIAEGVERESQHTLLREIGCDLAQGYWYAPPQPLAALRSLLAGRTTS